MMAFRGSDEHSVGAQNYRGQRTGGWEGPTLQRVLREYAFSDAYSAPMGSVPIIDLTEADGYKAPKAGAGDVLADFTTNSQVWNGANEGAIAAIRKMGSFQRSQSAGCARTKWILVGYSQGAMVARMTFETMGTSWVGSLYLVGDPFQKPNSAATRGEGRNGSGFYRWNWPSLRPGLDAYYAAKPASATSLCHNNDPICDFGTYGLGPHLNYFTSAAEKKTEGRVLARIVSRVVAETAAPAAPTTKDVEIMFAIDTTGSMGPYIEDAVASASDLGRRVLAISPGSRVGVVEYRDHGDSFVARTVLPLGRNVDDFQAGLEGLFPDEGGDTPEAVYSGIYEAGNASWAKGTSRSIAVIGDAPAHDPEDVTAYTAESTAQYLRSLGAAVVATPGAAARKAAPAETASGDTPRIFGLSDDSELSEQLRFLSNEVGGDVYQIGADGSVGELMDAVVEETVAAPEARLTVSTSLVGFNTVVSAASSSVSAMPATYDFDLDGDGSFETANAEATQVLQLPAGPHSLAVRVTDGEGRVSYATTQVQTLQARAALLPGASRPPALGFTPSALVAGEKLRVRLPGGAVSYIARLQSRDSRTVLTSSAPTPAREGAVNLTVPRHLAPGIYRLQLLADTGGIASRGVTVKQRPLLGVRAVRKPGKPKTRLLIVTATAPGGPTSGRVTAFRRGKPTASATVLRGRAVLTLNRIRPTKRRPVTVVVRFIPNSRYADRSQAITLRRRG